jgi:hypothetical protein
MLSMPPESESNTADTAEAIPDFQKPRPEVHTHEAQNGDESDHLKTEEGPTHPEVHAIDANSVAEEPVSVETNRSQTGGGEMQSETNLGPLERETASEARDVRPEPETKPPEEVHATPDDSEASSLEVLNIEPVETTHDSLPKQLDARLRRTSRLTVTCQKLREPPQLLFQQTHLPRERMLKPRRKGI